MEQSKYPITEFKNEYAFLSNFYQSPFAWNGDVWQTSEHAYQAAKCVLKSDYMKILNAGTPGIAKRLGKYVQLRKDWESVKIDFMRDIISAKFDQNPILTEMLLLTGDVLLEEGNTWRDNFWGVCPPGSNRGKNWLGVCLMDLRHQLAEAKLASKVS